MTQTPSPAPTPVQKIIAGLLVAYGVFRLVTVALELPALLQMGDMGVLVAYGLLPLVIALACLVIGGRMVWAARQADKGKRGE